jgi:hypothetical protein
MKNLEVIEYYYQSFFNQTVNIRFDPIKSIRKEEFN